MAEHSDHDRADEAPERALSGALEQAFGDAPPAALGVALSGGGDSVALLALLTEWAAPRGVKVRAITVDHGLRPGAAAEADDCARLCARLSVAHDLRRWQGWDKRGNLQDAARRARSRLIADWAAEHEMGSVCLGHTRDDQAETVLMRLARGSGVDGLSGMAPVRVAQGVTWLRPLLSVPRSALRDVLTARGLSWAEDPTNADRRYARVRARSALADLASLGITTRGLAETAERMASARAALSACVAAAAQQMCRVEGGDVVIAFDELRVLPDEMRERLLAQALRWVGSRDYPPRRAALRRARDAVRRVGRTTLHGCVLSREGDTLRITREWQAVRGLRAAPGALWDGRWRLAAPEGAAAAEVAALGLQGLAQLAHRREELFAGERDGTSGVDAIAKKTMMKQARERPDRGMGWRGIGLPRRTLLALPGLWQGERLMAVPLDGCPGFECRVLERPDKADFHASLLSH